MLKINNLTHFYSNANQQKVPIFKNFNLEIKSGEIVALLGPSGCGKTTLVNIIAGYILPTSGEIIVNGLKTSNPGKDRVVINQENDLFDWMTVYENMSLVSSSHQDVDKFLRLSGLHDFQLSYPGELSGGMKKRLSLARALAVGSKFIIMDEPFGSIDYDLRQSLYREFLSIVREAGITVLIVTHDIDEAIFLSEYIVLLGQKPTRILNKFKVNFCYPRQNEIRQLPEFMNIQKVIIEGYGSSRSAIGNNS